MTSNAFWHQGEIQSGRTLARPHQPLPDHSQTSLLPMPLLEGRLRIGLIVPDDHARIQMDILDPGTRELLAMRSRWDFRLSALRYHAREFADLLVDDLYALADPDPFQ